MLNKNDKDLFNKDILGAWVIFEKHDKKCKCSYCEKCNQERTFFLWLPKNKSRNSWRVLGWKKDNYNFYFRTTLPKWSRLFGFDLTTWNSQIHKGKKAFRLHLFTPVWCRVHNLRGLITYCTDSPFKTRIKNIESLFWINMNVATPNNDVVCDCCANTEVKDV